MLLELFSDRVEEFGIGKYRYPVQSDEWVIFTISNQFGSINSPSFFNISSNKEH